MLSGDKGVELTNTAAQNAANAADALASNSMTQATLDQVWQRERDMLDYAFKASESAENRALQIVLADKTADQYADARADSNQTFMYAALVKTLFGIF